MTDSNSNRRRNGCLVATAVVGLVVIATICVCCGIPYTGATVENAGPIALSEVGPDWSVEDNEGLSALLVAQDVSRDCTPMTNGGAILFQHAWYNAMTSGYDRRMWLEAPPGRYDSFGLYMWSNRIFLRDETSQNGFNNQILVCDRSDWTW